MAGAGRGAAALDGALAVGGVSPPGAPEIEPGMDLAPRSTVGSATPNLTSEAPRAAKPRPTRVGPITRGRLQWVSFGHSCIYAALLVCAFVAHNPQPLTFALGLGHGLLWIGMSLTCIVCARLRIVSLRLAVAVAVLGGIGPFFGSYEFVREQRRAQKDAGRTEAVKTL